MTFLDDVRQELCAAEVRSCCRSWEIRGFLDAWGQADARRLRVHAHSAAVARRLYTLLSEAGLRRVTVTRRPRSGFFVLAHVGDLRTWPPSGWPRRRCCRRSYARGLFLARGFLNSTRHGYHWEVKTPSETLAETARRALESMGIKGARTGRWQKGWVAYLKDAGLIADWLGQVGAHGSLLGFENARVTKDMRNKVNRRVNYETANLARTVAAALRQKENIRLIERTTGLDDLPPGLRDLAKARLAQPLASLAELAESLDTPLSKSGASHRMRRIMARAEQIRREHARRGQVAGGQTRQEQFRPEAPS